MAHTVNYLDKAGKPASATFPTKALADGYARNLRGPVTVVETGAEAAPVTVTACPEATPELQREAANGFYRAVNNGEKYVALRGGLDSERAAERRAERFAEARHCGWSTADALDHANGAR